MTTAKACAAEIATLIARLVIAEAQAEALAAALERVLQDPEDQCDADEIFARAALADYRALTEAPKP